MEGSSSNAEKENNSNEIPQPGASAERKQTLYDYLSENIEALKNEEMFAVIPLKHCSHLSTLKTDSLPSSIDTNAACQQCQSTAENWVCLLCYEPFCGRFIQEHMLCHHLDSDHALALSFSDLSVWCYKCDAYIDNPVLYRYKNLAHLNKFNEELVWSYGNETDENVILLE